MRIYGFLREPYQVGWQDLVYKVLLHETWREGTFAYLYTSPEALFCTSAFNAAPEDALEDWAEGLDQQDQGAPRRGHNKMFENGEWKDFTP